VSLAPTKAQRQNPSEETQLRWVESSSTCSFEVVFFVLVQRFCWQGIVVLRKEDAKVKAPSFLCHELKHDIMEPSYFQSDFQSCFQF
jgi:hypothetical protein